MNHVPVLRREVKEYLSLKGGEVVVDGTLGLGGHSLDILRSIGSKGRLVAFEQDKRNLEEAKKRLETHSEQIIYFNENFRYLKTRITGEGIEQVDAVLLDLGLSSPHVDEADRGFSFNKEGPLDMRFDPRNPLTAAEVLNNYSEQELREIFYKYGEEKMAPKFARKICERRKNKEFKTTTELAQFLEDLVPKKHSRGKKAHPATRIFQALRIEVNDELTVLEEVLPQAVEILKVGGRIVVITYHSLEDRIVKHFFKNLERPEVESAEEALYKTHGDPIVKKNNKKPVIPSEEEIALNPRSRSAKLRAYQKIKPYSHSYVSTRTK